MQKQLLPQQETEEILKKCEEEWNARYNQLSVSEGNCLRLTVSAVLLKRNTKETEEDYPEVLH